MYARRECKKETSVGKLVQMVLMLLGILTLVSALATFDLKGPIEAHAEVMIFINSES